MRKHTPGPWHVDSIGLVRSQTGLIISQGGVDDMEPDECAANARLLAAGPDLLAELKRLHHLERYMSFLGCRLGCGTCALMKWIERGG